MNEESRRNRRHVALAIAALVVATVARIIYLRSLPGGGTFLKYLWFADEILAGRLHADRLADLSPAYLWVVALLRWLSVGDWTLRSIQVAMVSGVALCAGIVARRMGGWWAAIAAAVLVLANRAALINASEFEPETLLLFLEAISIVLVVRAERSHRRAGMAGLFIGLAIVTRPVALLVAVVLGATMLWRSRRVPWLFAAAAAVPVVVTLAVNAKLTGDMVIMDPGTVFFEGMNPRASGLTGAMPAIVLDLQPSFEGTDTLHVVYRVLASRAAGRDLSREESNRWWARRAFAYARLFPGEAARLTIRKLHAALQAYDAWDVPSSAVLQRSMTGIPWIPWSFAIGLALTAFLMIDRRDATVLLLLAAATGAPMLVFFVTGRHRNPLLLPIAILGGLAIAKLSREFASGNRRRALFAAATGALAALLLTIPTEAVRADDYEVRSGIELRALQHAKVSAEQAGQSSRAVQLHAAARTLAPEWVSLPPRDLLAAAARAALREVDDTQRLFRLGIALDDANVPDEALRVLDAVHETDARPTRSLPPPSLRIAHIYARRHQLEQAREWLAKARGAAPSDVDVLAFAAALDRDPRALDALKQLFDPFTQTLALNQAENALCSDDPCRRRADLQLEPLRAVLPVWKRPAALLAERRRAW